MPDYMDGGLCLPPQRASPASEPSSSMPVKSRLLCVVIKAIYILILHRYYTVGDIKSEFPNVQSTMLYGEMSIAFL